MGSMALCDLATRPKWIAARLFFLVPDVSGIEPTWMKLLEESSGELQESYRK